MHIVLANQWFPPESGWGGVGMYNYAVARAYRALGHQVTVIASRLSPQIPAFHETDGICVRRLSVRDAYRWRRIPLAGRYVRAAQQLAYSRRVDRALRDLHREQPIDVVEFAEINAEGFTYLRSPQVPVVVRCHTPTFVLRRYYMPREMSYDSIVIGWCEKDSIGRANSVTAPSKDMAQLISQECRLPIENICVIPNALSVSEFTAGRSKDLSAAEISAIPFSEPPITILHVGRLERVKGVQTLARAIPRVIREWPNARFVFVGEDRATAHSSSQRAELETELTDACASSNVLFAGAVERPVLLDWYLRADICVIPSQVYESFSYTCAQAMAAGKPVIASRIGGIPETLNGGECGLLITPGDPVELAGAIVQLLREPQTRKRLGEAGRERAAREFDPVRVARKNLDVYERAGGWPRHSKG